tara:strand:+ start:1268 stop:1438 length:171 start_codon:yes stop_codon:yes gene_type:complete
MNVGLVTPVPVQLPPDGDGVRTVFKLKAALLAQIEYVGRALGITGETTKTVMVSKF